LLQIILLQASGVARPHFNKPLPRLLENIGYLTAITGRETIIAGLRQKPFYGISLGAGQSRYEQLAQTAATWINEKMQGQMPWFMHLVLPGISTIMDFEPSKSEKDGGPTRDDSEPGDDLPSQTCAALGSPVNAARVTTKVLRDSLLSDKMTRMCSSPPFNSSCTRRLAYKRGIRVLDCALSALISTLNPLLNDNYAKSSSAGASDGGGLLVVFTAMIGSPVQDRGLSAASSLKVPLIISWPGGVTPARGSPALASMVRIPQSLSPST